MDTLLAIDMFVLVFVALGLHSTVAGSTNRGKPWLLESHRESTFYDEMKKQGLLKEFHGARAKMKKRASSGSL